MDSFGNYPREKFDPFSVMLFKGLQVVAFLFFIALLAMNPEAKSGKIDTKAEFIITHELARQPSRRHRPLCRGPASATSSGITCARPASWCSTATTAAGSTIPSSVAGKRSRARSGRRPSASAASSPGEYTVNVNHYLATTGAAGAGRGEGREGQSRRRGRALRHLTLDRTGHERTAVRFRIADNGSVIDVNHREKSLIQLTRSVRRTEANK